ncbi:sugar nucleotide-binding protein [Kangiella sp. TOML190]|uniref:sugar nucleotide-binding protein n=1 Tax=Kangiella sp. TOML190 TaxID=2931351 RepID=UPI00203B0708|nr:sugar nucleotide-binding protein [Kangiella sp. TOML190]
MAIESSLIVGAGKFGRRFYDFLQAHGQDPITLSKSDKAWSQQHIRLDLLAKSLQLPSLPKIDQLYLIVAPTYRTQEAYQNIYIDGLGNLLRALLKQQRSFHATFLSSTAVYGSQRLGLIDENSPTQPDNFRGELLLQAEQQIQQMAPSSSIVRASGLYSRQRERLLQSLLDKQKASDAKWLNLVHEADLCQWLLKASENQWPSVIASDGVPFQRTQLYQEQAVDKQGYRQFKSQYFEQMDLQYVSFVDWFDSL